MTDRSDAAMPDEDPMAAAVFEALGAASTCWESMEGTGLFDSDRAKQIGDELLAKIAELHRPDSRDALLWALEAAMRQFWADSTEASIEDVRLFQARLRSALEATPMPLTVWIVNSRGVHSAELCGVYVSEKAAAVAALEFANKADGYHTFEVTELPLDSAVETPELDRHLGVGAPKVTYSPLEEQLRIAHFPLARIQRVDDGGR